MSQETILVVDDEIANLQKLQRTFVNRYRVIAAGSGREALDIARKNEVAVIVADQRMPDMTGIELLRETLDILPDAVRIILTGFTDASVLLEAINRCKVYRYIVKPWEPADLLLAVEKGLEGRRLARENELFRKELVRRERLARELEIAREIQHYILPSAPPALEEYEIAVEYNPAREVGGDLYDFDATSQVLQLVVADVSGKSIPAALYGAVFSGQLRTVFSEAPSPARALEILNNNLVARYKSRNYIAVAYCRVNIADGSAILANGGMPFPFVIRGDAVDRLRIPGVPLGLMEGMSYEELRFQLDPGDILILASDGVMDALNPEGAFYDEGRFVESLQRHSREHATGLLKQLNSDLHHFVGNAELSDDVTIIAVRRN